MIHMYVQMSTTTTHHSSPLSALFAVLGKRSCRLSSFFPSLFYHLLHMSKHKKRRARLRERENDRPVATTQTSITSIQMVLFISRSMPSCVFLGRRADERYPLSHSARGVTMFSARARTGLWRRRRRQAKVRNVNERSIEFVQTLTFQRGKGNRNDERKRSETNESLSQETPRSNRVVLGKTKHIFYSLSSIVDHSFDACGQTHSFFLSRSCSSGDTQTSLVEQQPPQIG